MIIPGALSVYNMIIARTFIANIPADLEEAAKIDGCTDFQYFMKLVLPLSRTVMAVLALYYAVGHWNSYFSALLYISDENLQPLQLHLRKVLILNSSQTMMDMASDEAARQAMRAETIKYAVIVLSSVPMLIMYPFVQRFFIKGVMIGSVKG
jgi:putative aldouronate transport system permease protein